MRQTEHRQTRTARPQPSCDQAARAFRRARHVGSALALILSTGLLGHSAHAQMVPRGTHLLSQGLTTARLPWPVRPVGASLVPPTRSASETSDEGKGLSLRSATSWLNWEGRIGAVIERPVNPVHDNFVLAQPAQGGLRMRSLHVLADHYVSGGFRATVGLVSGEAGQAWWSSGDTGGGLNLSLQQLDTLGTPMGKRRNNLLPQAQAYIGAGYSTRSDAVDASQDWRFNADFGLIDTASSSADRLGGMLQGERSVDDVVRGLRMRPVLKVSVGYAF